MQKSNSEEKPTRLYFKSYLQLIKNSPGSNMFRNFYVSTPSKGEFDAFGDGDFSCAFFVTAILKIFGKIDDFHGLVEGAQKKLIEHGWQEVDKPTPGDVVVWEPMQFPQGPMRHIGFAIGGDKAISTSWKKRTVVEHDINFGGRKIEKIYRYRDWENDAKASR